VNERGAASERSKPCSEHEDNPQGERPAQLAATVVGKVRIRAHRHHRRLEEHRRLQVGRHRLRRADPTFEGVLREEKALEKIQKTRNAGHKGL